MGVSSERWDVCVFVRRMAFEIDLGDREDEQGNEF